MNHPHKMLTFYLISAEPRAILVMRNEAEKSAVVEMTPRAPG